VTFTGSYFGTGYSVDYGDGSLGPNQVCSFNCTAAQKSVSLRHTYVAAGTFTATLTDSRGGKATVIVSSKP